MKRFLESILPRIVLTFGFVAISLLYLLSTFFHREIPTRHVIAAVFVYVCASFPLTLRYLNDLDKRARQGPPAQE